MGYDDIYTGDTEYARGLADHLHSVIQLIGKDRFGADELELATLLSSELFGEESDALSVLWQNRLLGYVEHTPDGPREVFFSELNSDHFNLPLDMKEYLLHSCMVDCAGIRAVGPPVGQGAMDDPTLTRGQSATNPGQIGAYPILGVIGRGGMGTVYLAEDPRLKRRVAIKVLPDPGPQNAESQERFKYEAQVLATLNHPNIATVFSLEDENGTHFITMEYVAGDTLASRIKESLLTFDQSMRICRQIAVALEAAHRQGVVHRDLKPANIMVTQDDHVKILDFGLAKVVASYAGESKTTVSLHDLQTMPGAVMGTVGYMSPEQLRGRPVDGRSDIWAFGCCLYECLSGRKALAGETPPERMVATMERDPDWDILSDAPAPILKLVQQCLKKDPGERLANMTEAINLIDQVPVAQKRAPHHPS